MQCSAPLSCCSPFSWTMLPRMQYREGHSLSPHPPVVPFCVVPTLHVCHTHTQVEVRQVEVGDGVQRSLD